MERAYLVTSVSPALMLCYPGGGDFTETLPPWLEGIDLNLLVPQFPYLENGDI